METSLGSRVTEYIELDNGRLRTARKLFEGRVFPRA